MLKHFWRERKPVVWGVPKGIWRSSLYLKKCKCSEKESTFDTRILPKMVSRRKKLITVDLLADLSKFILTDRSVNLPGSRHKSSVRTYIISYSFKRKKVVSDLAVKSRMTTWTTRFLSSCVHPCLYLFQEHTNWIQFTMWLLNFFHFKQQNGQDSNFSLSIKVHHVCVPLKIWHLTEHVHRACCHRNVQIKCVGKNTTQWTLIC